ncbi:MAG: Hint domain-containing protein [Acidocella sp.]|nr:Hint domain-containing protein [Acidocella sp.]
MSETISTYLNTPITVTSPNVVITSRGGTNGYASITGYGISAALFAPGSLGSVTINNAGDIFGKDSSAPNSIVVGIALAQPGTITNTGVIGGNSGIGIIGTVGSSYVRNSHLIQAYYGAAIYLQSNGTIANTGQIITYKNTGNTGIELKSGGLITNLGGGVISGGQTGIYLDNGGTIVNAHNISGYNQAGIYDSAGSALITNTGNIVGATAGIVLKGGGTIINDGGITGNTSDAISFASGFANRLVLESGTNITGLVDGGNSVGSSIVSTLELAGPGGTYVTGIGSQYINFTTIVNDANANWIIGGSNTLANGATLDNLGTLAINGAFTNNGIVLTGTSPLTVNAAVYGTGIFELGANANVTFTSTAASSQTVELLSPTATLSVDNAFQGKIIAAFVHTLTSQFTEFFATETIIASGGVGTYLINNNGTPSAQTLSAAVFGPSSLSNPTLLNQGFIDANGPSTLGAFDAGILLGGTGSIINTGTILGHTALAILGTSGSNYVYNSNLIYGTYGGAMYLHNTSTIINNGIIFGKNTIGGHGSDTGIELGSGGTVINRTSGTIASHGNYAVDSNGPLSVSNAGLITGYSGINSNGTAFISNASTGFINAYRTGIELNGGGTVLNAGAIQATGTQTTYTPFVGVYLTQGGAILNSGSITGPVGVKILGTIGAPGYVENSQLISASSTASPNANVSNGFVNFGAGVYINVAGSVVNSGTIIGNHAGVAFNNSNGGRGTINNTGSISSSAGYGVLLEDGGSVSNSSIISGYRTGIRADNAVTTIFNTGIILGTGNTFSDNGTLSAKNLGPGTYVSHGIALNNGGTIFNEATGTISAVQGVEISGTNHSYIFNAGLIDATNRSGINLKDLGTVNNTGTILANNSGVQLYNGGYFKNGGLITATNKVGVYLAKYENVTNNGTINANYAGIYAYKGAYVRNSGNIASTLKAGVYLKAAGNVSNSGTIIGNGSGVFLANGVVTNLHPGTIIGGDGILATKGNVTNQSFVDGTVSAGIYLQGSGSIFNAAAGTFQGTKYGVELGGSSSYLGNFGTANGSIGVYIKAGGYLKNSGTALGTIGVYAKSGGVISDSGVISGTADAVKFGPTGGGKLIINPGASFTGTVDGGHNASMELGGTSHVTLSGLGTQFINFSTIKVDAGSFWTLSGNSTLAAGQTLNDFGTLIVNGNFVDNGVVNADPSTIVYDSAVTGTGTIDIAAGSTIIFDGSVASSITIDFLAATGTIVENAPTLFSNPTILNPSNGVIIIACFAAGTRILTPNGEMAVETLREGDLVITAEGEDAPIKWIGTRKLDLQRHAHPQKAQPVRITQGAISHNVPSRDLLLSPDHALYLQGHLVPAKALINRMSVTQENWQSVSYYHIELDHHAVIFAEGAPVETYLETGNRHCFENAGLPMTLHPDFGQDFQAMREAQSCAPFLDDDGPLIRRIRIAMLDRAYWNTPRRAANS